VKLLPAGEHGVLVEVDRLETVHRLAAAVRAAGLSGVRDVVPGARTLLVTVDEDSCSDALAALAPALTELHAAEAEARDRRTGDPSGRREDAQVVAVVYDGPDLDHVAELTGLTPDGVVERHTGADYVVAFLGFVPGFPYLVGLDRSLHVPRRSTPRTKVPAGAVGIAGSQTGIYPRESPGGWQLVGHTDAVLFDVEREPPAMFAAGDRVRFVRADR
jgi:KipI family sensor histidine kinase inhibitor